jgi:UDP-N-acetylglucosamine acyltransferase
MAEVHPTAIIDDDAEIGAGVRVGAYSVVGAGVCLEEGVVLEPHVVVSGQTRVGSGSHVFPFASIGSIPQDMKYAGEASDLVIGPGNVIREHVTMNPGTEGGGMTTRTGRGCLFMVGSHVAHDCQIGDHVILVNNATLGGHVEVHDHAIVGGLSAVHQFVRIGRHAMVGGMTGVENDVIPYGSVTGNRARLSGLNIVGLKRRGFSREAIHALRGAFRLLFAEGGTFQERLAEVAEAFAGSPEVMHIVDFIRADSTRSLCQPIAEGAG